MKKINITDLCIIEIGRTPSRSNSDYWGEGENWISIRDIKSKYIYDTAEQITLKAINETGIKKVPINTVIMSFKLSIGKVAIAGKDMYTNEAIAAFHIIDEKKLYYKYLFYALQTINFSDSTDRAVMGMTLNKQKLSKLMIPVPKIETQKKIVEVLDKAQALIDARKEQIRLMDELIQAQFIEMFGDPITNSKSLPTIELGKACNMKAGKNKKASDIIDVIEDGVYPCFGGNGIRGYVKEYSHEGEIPLIGRQGALCGNVHLASGKFYATEHAIVTETTIGWNATWLYIMLSKMNLNRLSSGAAQPGLNVGTLIPLNVINPDIIHQNQFANYVKKINNFKYNIQISLKELQGLYDVLISIFLNK